MILLPVSFGNLLSSAEESRAVRIDNVITTWDRAVFERLSKVNTQLLWFCFGFGFQHSHSKTALMYCTEATTTDHPR